MYGRPAILMWRRAVAQCSSVYGTGGVRNFASKFTRRLGRKQMKNMSSKRGNKNYYKGKGVPSEGRLTSKGILSCFIFLRACISCAITSSSHQIFTCVYIRMWLSFCLGSVCVSACVSSVYPSPPSSPSVSFVFTIL